MACPQEREASKSTRQLAPSLTREWAEEGVERVLRGRPAEEEHDAPKGTWKTQEVYLTGGAAGQRVLQDRRAGRGGDRVKCPYRHRGLAGALDESKKEVEMTQPQPTADVEDCESRSRRLQERVERTHTTLVAQTEGYSTQP